MTKKSQHSLSVTPGLSMWPPDLKNQRQWLEFDGLNQIKHLGTGGTTAFTFRDEASRNTFARTLVDAIRSHPEDYFPDVAFKIMMIDRVTTENTSVTAWPYYAESPYGLAQ